MVSLILPQYSGTHQPSFFESFSIPLSESHYSKDLPRILEEKKRKKCERCCMVNHNRILATRICTTFAFWSVVGPAAIITFLHIGSHHSVISEAAVTYLFTMLNHVTYSPYALHIIAVFWPSHKPASSCKKM